MKRLKIYYILIMLFFSLCLIGCNKEHIHNYEEIIVEPTCTQNGCIKNVCECGETIVLEELLKRHNYEEIIVKPTCTQNGYIEKVCECGESFIEKELLQIEHSFNDWVIVKEATKESIGLQEKTCNICGYKEESIITYSDNEYLDYSFDENISVITQIIEKRQNSKQTNIDYEKSVYDIYFYIKKTSNFDLKDIYISVDVKTKNGIKTSKSIISKELIGPSTIVSTINITNFLANEILIEGDVIKHINEIPEFLYFKISYNKINNEQVENCELNYKIKYDDVTEETFEDYQQRQIVKNDNDIKYIDYKNEFISIKFLKIPVETSSEAVKCSDYRLSNVKMVKSNLPEETMLSKIKIEVFAEITNESIITKDYFSKYVKLFVYEGVFVTDITGSRTSSLADDYEVEKIYFNIEIELNNGTEINYKYYILTEDLLIN